MEGDTAISIYKPVVYDAVYDRADNITNIYGIISAPSYTAALH